MCNSGDNTLSQERKINRIRSILLKTIYRSKSGFWRADYLKRCGVFRSMGNNCYYEPKSIPSDACLVSIGNNVRIACGVEFITHDIFSQMFNAHPEYSKRANFKVHFGSITIQDNVCIGGVLIMPDVTIGSNVIVAGGSVVTKNVEDGTVVGGNPAKVIGKIEDLVEKRVNITEIDNWNSTREELEKFYWGGDK